MDAEELALILAEISERTAGDDEAYHEAIVRLTEMLASEDQAE